MSCQSGILEPLLPARHYLELRLAPGATGRQLGAALASLPSPSEQLHLVVAFGPAALELLGSEVRLEPFQEIRGPHHGAPATQRALWVGISGADRSTVFDAALAAHRALRGVATLELDLSGFDYHQSRDLTGFEDGTANPKEDKAEAAAVIAEGPGAGGSIVFTQKWIHDLDGFAKLPVDAQEQVIGRTKKDSIELEGDAMPPDSHVSRTDVKVEGTALKILRRSSPYGGAGEHGLYFVSYACERRRVQIQLERMFGVAGDDRWDRITDYSRAVSGSYWFAPSREELGRLAQAD